MKRFLALILACLMCLAFVGCSSDKTDDTSVTESNASQQVNEDEFVKEDTSGINVKKDVDVEAVVNSFAEEFDVDITRYGEVKEESFSINSNRMILDGETYSFPIRLQNLYDNGWAVSDVSTFAYDEISSGKSSTIGLILEKDSNRIWINNMNNYTDAECKIADCYTSSIMLIKEDVSDLSEFVFAGGITQNSTAADVFTYFGSPMDTTEFNGGSVIVREVEYWKNNVSNLTYTYQFEDNGDIEYISISLVDDLSY